MKFNGYEPQSNAGASLRHKANKGFPLFSVTYLSSKPQGSNHGRRQEEKHGTDGKDPRSDGQERRTRIQEGNGEDSCGAETKRITDTRHPRPRVTRRDAASGSA